jgi:hypothetical protein
MHGLLDRNVFLPERLLAHVPASIKVDGLTGDIAVRGQQEDGVSHLLGSAKAAHGQKGGPDAAVVANHIGLDERWRDSVRGDAFFRQQIGITVHEAEHAGFASSVVRTDDAASLCSNRGEEEEASPLTLAHAG